jgi:hypothetical protein
MMEHPNGGVIIMGGSASFGTSSTLQTAIHYLQSITGPWQTLSQSLYINRENFVAMNVPTAITNCAGWSNWGAWTTCTKTCQSGTQSHTRTCTNPSPTTAGFTCAGASTESSACNVQDCPSKKIISIN